MAEAAWYFAKGDTEQGPVTLAQLQGLLATGQLGPEDLVWKEGMEDWSSAGNVPELHASSTARPSRVASPSARTTDPSLRDNGTTRPFAAARTVERMFAFGGPLGRPLILIGLVSVIMTRGCDTLGDRFVSRAEAIAQSAQQQFQADWDQQRAELEAERDELLDRSRTPQEQERADELSEELNSLDATMREEMQRLQRTRWREYESQARQADHMNRMWSYWRSLFFVLGTMVLATGLILTGLTGTPPERWLCLVLLAVILFSVYVVGAVWTG